MINRNMKSWLWYNSLHEELVVVVVGLEAVGADLVDQLDERLKDCGIICRRVQLLLLPKPAVPADRRARGPRVGRAAGLRAAVAAAAAGATRVVWRGAE